MNLKTLTTIGLFLYLTVACSSKEEKKFVAQDAGAIITKEVIYKSENQTMKGFLAIPVGEGPFPAVLVVHEWWGQTDYPRQRARQLAEAGYVAFAVDMYGDGKTLDHPKDAKSFAGKVMADMNAAEQNFIAAMNALKKEEMVDANKLAAIGYCFGGGVVLEMGRRNVGLKMVASYHGDLSPLVKNKVEKNKTRFLIFNGTDDSFVTEEAIQTTRKKLKEAKVRYKLFNFKGAKHGFSNPMATKKGKEFDLPLEYNQRADETSWQQTLDAFKIVFK